MSYFLKKIVCLAISRKNYGHCIAGKEITNDLIGSWIRPVSSRTTHEISEQECQFKNRGVPEILDIIKIPFKEHNPTSFQNENYLINDNYYWEQIGHFDLGNLANICDQPKTLWGKDSSSYYGSYDRIHEDSSNGINSSLYLITTNTLEILVREEGRKFDNPKRKVRARFSYRGINYILPVTDPVIENSYLAKDDDTYVIQRPYDRIFMCISIGLPHKDGYCYKFVASIIGLP